MKKIFVILPLISFLAFGCNIKNITKLGSSNKAENPPAPFTLETLKNANYRFEVKELADVYNKDNLKLTNGKYFFALPQGAERNEYLTQLDMDDKLVVRPNSYAFGDMDNDGQADAAVVITSMAGKNRVYKTLAVLLNKKGLADYAAGAVLDQGVEVDSIVVKDGKIEVSEKLANGGEEKKVIFRLNGNELVKE